MVVTNYRLNPTGTELSVYIQTLHRLQHLRNKPHELLPHVKVVFVVSVFRTPKHSTASTSESGYSQQHIPNESPGSVLNLQMSVHPAVPVEVDEEVGAGLLGDTGGLLDGDGGVPPSDDDVFEYCSHGLRTEQSPLIDLHVCESRPREKVPDDCT